MLATCVFHLDKGQAQTMKGRQWGFPGSSVSPPAFACYPSSPSLFRCPGRWNSMGCINQALLPFAFCLNSVNIRPRGKRSRTSLFPWFPSCPAGDWQWMYLFLLSHIEKKTSQIDGCFGWQKLLPFHHSVPSLRIATIPGVFSRLLWVFFCDPIYLRIIPNKVSSVTPCNITDLINRISAT